MSADSENRPLNDDEILRSMEDATVQMALAETEIKADAAEIKRIKDNGRNSRPLRGPGFFSVLGMAVRGLFEL